MAINLKQISTSDSDNIKLDKVNYNFDQLVANGGGPQGPLGPKGDTGFQGVMGPQGFQGTMGFQGNVGQPGANTESYWKRIDGDNSSLTTDTLFPVALVPGALNPPVISIGFLSSDPEYNTHQSLNNGQSPYQWIINRKAHFYSNLRFKSSDVLDNHFDFRIHYDQAINKTIFRMSFKESGFALPTRIIWNADNHIFKSNVIGTNILSISTNLITFDKDAHFNSPVKINSELYIENAAAGLNKIATSVDASGLVTFKSIQELGGTVPYGTIISILPSVFADNTRFINAQTIDLTQLPNTINDALKIIVGAGIGDYEGWYLCNGQYWTDGTVQGTTLVPDLNSFSYSIPDNTASTDINSQGNAGGVPNNAINIVGGADINMTANFQGAGTYAIGQTIQTNDVVFNTATGATPFKIKKLPQIIYLAKSNLYWSDKGTGQAPTTTLNFQLVDANTVSPNLGTISAGAAAYTQGGSYFHQAIITAPAGYYWNSIPTLTYPGYIDGIIKTLAAGVNPTTLTLDISVDIQPANGTMATIGIDTSGMFTALPTVPIQLFQTGTYPAHATMYPYFGILPVTVNYNLNSGYTFDLIVTAEADYLFTAPLTAADISIPYVNNGVMTINSRTFTGSGDEGSEVTVNVTLTGVNPAFQVNFHVSAEPTLQLPAVWLETTGTPVYPITQNAGSANVIVYNNTDVAVYIKMKLVNQVNNYASVFADNDGISGNSLSAYSNFQGVVYSPNYYTLAPRPAPNTPSTMSIALYTLDPSTSYTAGLVWSFSTSLADSAWFEVYNNL